MGVCGDMLPNCTPIVIAVGQDSNYQFTSAEDGVWFDMDGDGVLNLVAWTRPGDPVAFLALDLNGNGIIDNGTELFGNSTILPNGQSVGNGFDALAYYDANGDGIIDPLDPIWPSLRLWIDWNHDGVSQNWELYRLEDWGVTSISVEYRTINRRDAYGNLYRLQASCKLGGRTRFAYDVYFSAKPSRRPN